MKPHRVVLALVVSAELAIATGGMAQANNAPAASPAMDPRSEYVYSVEDTEMPTSVQARAQAALGSRFVELWIASDQKSYVVGVLNLQPSEVATLTSAVRRTAPVSFVNRTVSRAQIDQTLAVVTEYANKVGRKIQAYGPDYAAGNVFVETPSPYKASIESALKSQVAAATAAMRANGVAQSPAPINVSTGSISP